MGEEGISPWVVLSYFRCPTTARCLFQVSKEILSESHVAERESSSTPHFTGILLQYSKQTQNQSLQEFRAVQCQSLTFRSFRDSPVYFFWMYLFLGIFDQSVIQPDLYHLLKGKPIGLSGRATLLLLAELHLPCFFLMFIRNLLLCLRPGRFKQKKTSWLFDDISHGRLWNITYIC